MKNKKLHIWIALVVIAFLCAWQSLDAETVSKEFVICVLESIFAEV